MWRGRACPGQPCNVIVTLGADLGPVSCSVGNGLASCRLLQAWLHDDMGHRHPLQPPTNPKGRKTYLCLSLIGTCLIFSSFVPSADIILFVPSKDHAYIVPCDCRGFRIKHTWQVVYNYSIDLDEILESHIYMKFYLASLNFLTLDLV